MKYSICRVYFPAFNGKRKQTECYVKPLHMHDDAMLCSAIPYSIEAIQMMLDKLWAAIFKFHSIEFNQIGNFIYKLHVHVECNARKRAFGIVRIAHRNIRLHTTPTPNKFLWTFIDNNNIIIENAQSLQTIYTPFTIYTPHTFQLIFLLLFH